MVTPAVPAAGFVAAIGATPLVCLERLARRTDVEVWAKLEGCNPGGSAKDRSAWAMLSDALATGAVRPGGTIIESSSGNLGMALARLCAVHGLRFVCVADQGASPQALDVIRAVGGTVRMVDGPDPETGELLVARQNLVRDLLARDPDAVSLDQYANPAPLEAHAQGTMREITDALGAVDEVYVATSTTGTIGGCRRWLRDNGMDTVLVAVDPVGSVLFGGARAHRELNGYGAGSVPALAEHADPDVVARVAELDAVAGARHLARTEGILPGASGGAVVSALLDRIDALPAGARVAVVLHDFGWAYLHSIDDDDWVTERLGVDQAALESAVAASLRRAAQ